MTAHSRLPTGAQHQIRHGDQVAVVTEVGATLRRYDVGDRPVLEAFDEAAIPDGGHGQVLAPWPNRVRDGRYRWDGADLQLALSEAAKHNAIHGLVRWAGWSAAEVAPDAVTMTTTLWPTPGYPFLLELAATYRLGADGLSVELTARNEGSSPAPYGVGQHPYLAATTGRADDVTLTVPARSRLLVDDRGNPVGREDVDGTPFDFRSPRRVGDLVLDTAYTDLLRDPDGRARVRLDGADGSGAEVWCDAATHWLQVFSGDTLAPHRRRTALAVEAMSCPPGAFESGEHLVRLAPGEDHRLTWGLRAW